jgi:hypothetical protein
VIVWGALALKLRVALCEALCACALQIINILFEALRARFASFFNLAMPGNTGFDSWKQSPSL